MNRNILWVVLFMMSQLLTAQINGSNQAVYQVGNQPERLPANRSNLYDQLNLRYNTGAVSLGLRAEIYKTDSPFEYNHITQKFIGYKTGNLSLRLGNFYEIIGRGLLLRSYELPGVVYEDTGTQQRYGFYKDIEGLSLRYESDFIRVKALAGRPLDFSRPPVQGRSGRRRQFVQGGEVNFLLEDAFTPGAIYLRSDANGVATEYNGLNLDGFWENFQYYVEYVQNSANSSGSFRLGRNGAHAFYTSFSMTLERASLSFEYKDYNDFTLIFNDPPPLVREHTYTLLNRSTHSIEPNNETGYQLEVMLDIGANNSITLNHSRAINRLGGTRYTFYEYYADINYYFTDDVIGKAFVDYSKDELVSQKDRKTIGASGEWGFAGDWGVISEVQWQRFKRDFIFNPSQNHFVENRYLNISVNKGPRYSVGIILENSDDPVETNQLGKKKSFTFKTWPAFLATYQYNQQNIFNLFAGKRRGGNACTGGICYRVLDFEGVELSLITRF